MVLGMLLFLAEIYYVFHDSDSACVGRNLASMELLIILASIMRRYDIVLEDPNLIVRIVTFESISDLLKLIFA